MSYNDLSKPDVRHGFPKVMEQLQKGELTLPAVFVDEQMVSLGYVDYFSIARAIEQARSDRMTSN